MADTAVAPFARVLHTSRSSVCVTLCSARFLKRALLSVAPSMPAARKLALSAAMRTVPVEGYPTPGMCKKESVSC
jgi:hypothetical protein